MSAGIWVKVVMCTCLKRAVVRPGKDRPII